MKKQSLIIWYVVWVVFYVALVILNYCLYGSDLVKMLSCVGIGLNILFVHLRSPKDYLLQIALVFTLLSDMIIATGASAFLCVFAVAFAQFFHFSRLAELKTRAFLWFLMILMLTVYLSSLLGADLVFMMGTFSACFLCGNLILSVSWYRKARTLSSMCAMLGFALFALCDICVALSYHLQLGTMSPSMQEAMDYMSWIFYYPSQIFIALSGKV